jgi:hypothetical protein
MSRAPVFAPHWEEIRVFPGESALGSIPAASN